MLTLISGVPGAGKGTVGVDLLLEVLKDGARPLYVIEIPEDNVPPVNLKLPHKLIGPESPDPELRDPTKWPELVPDGCVIYMPEAQRLWGTAPASARVPHHIEAIGQHRHRGIDIVIDTQNPKLLHDKVRLRVGRLIHLRDLGILGRWWYEWPEVEDVSRWRQAPVKKRFRLPKKVFGLYTSATAHQKPIRSVPPSVYVFAVALVVLIALAARFVYRVNEANSSPAAEEATKEPAKGPSGLKARPGPDGRGWSLPVTGTTLTVAFMPRLSHDPGSAPAYDHLRQVKVMPRIVGGFCRDGVCRCFTQQGTDPGVPEQACAAFIASPPFDPYREEERQPAALGAGVAPSRALVGGDQSAAAAAAAQ